MVALALRQPPPGPAIVQWDGLDYTVMSPTCPVKTLLPEMVQDV